MLSRSVSARLADSGGEQASRRVARNVEFIAPRSGPAPTSRVDVTLGEILA